MALSFQEADALAVSIAAMPKEEVTEALLSLQDQLIGTITFDFTTEYLTSLDESKARHLLLRTRMHQAESTDLGQEPSVDLSQESFSANLRAHLRSGWEHIKDKLKIRGEQVQA